MVGGRKVAGSTINVSTAFRMHGIKLLRNVIPEVCKVFLLKATLSAFRQA